MAYTFPNNIKAGIEEAFLAQALELTPWKLSQAVLTIKYVQLVNSYELVLQNNYMYIHIFIFSCILLHIRCANDGKQYWTAGASFFP